MFSEFCIGKDLEHPNIIKYKYFMRKFDPSQKLWEFHIIMDLMKGSSMTSFIEKNQPIVEVPKDKSFILKHV